MSHRSVKSLTHLTKLVTLRESFPMIRVHYAPIFCDPGDCVFIMTPRTDPFWPWISCGMLANHLA